MSETTVPSTSDDRIVHTFPKNAREEVRVSLSSFKGRRLIDLRVYYRSEAGELKPTPKGLTIARELLPALEASVLALRAAVADDEAAE